MLNATEDRVSRGLADIAKLRRFAGPPSEFWPAFVAAAGAIAGAGRGILLLKDAKDQAWKKLGEWSQTGHADRTVLAFNRQLAELGASALRQGVVSSALEQTATSGLRHYAIAAKLALSRPEDACVAALLLLSATEQQAQDALVRLQLVADAPLSYLQSHSTSQARTDIEKFAASLDVLTIVNAEKKFLAATLALCNAVAGRYAADRVSLGWLEGGYIRLKSISRTERFDKNMAAVKALELTMEECLDQDDEIVFPAPDGAQAVSRDHEKYAAQNSSGHICSIPIRADGGAVAVLCCERQERAFSPGEVQQLRLACDQAARRLSDLHERDGWFGLRWKRQAKAGLAKTLGPEHTWAKALAILGAVALAVLFFGRFAYRVEGNFILKSDAVSYVTAPFDGFIKEVPVRPGDALKQGSLLLQMDTDDLGLEEAGALAEQVRYQREAEKARATNGLAEMRIALALADQAKARLDMARHRLGQSALRASFDGIVVEGDLREKIGSPIKQGDALFKLTKMEGMYFEAEINQRDVHELKVGAPAEIAFVTQPKLKFKARVERIYPAAVTKDAENVFVVRLALAEPGRAWWRPGMSGLVKIGAGDRTLFWIVTHRTVDFLRMWLWW